MDPNAGKFFLPARRRRMNWIPMLLCTLAPVGMVALVAGVLSFQLRYTDPTLAWVLAIALLLVSLAFFGVAACIRQNILFKSVPREPSWLTFLSASLLLAWIVGFVVGVQNYSHTQGFYDFRSLNSYSDVDVSSMRGQQLMDAGEVIFAEGTRLDLKKAMGFKNSKTYCVVPITRGSEQLPTYDFWAVGTNCCSSTSANFYCPGFNDKYANGGLRLMSDGDRAFYRLAVQEAEAAYKIKAVHPLFFEWSVDPTSTVNGWRYSAFKTYLAWVCSFFMYQVFATAVTAMYFSKLGAA